jgi:hypothetical protein
MIIIMPLKKLYINLKDSQPIQILEFKEINQYYNIFISFECYTAILSKELFKNFKKYLNI